jgi:hypothetical protein
MTKPQLPDAHRTQSGVTPIGPVLRELLGSSFRPSHYPTLSSTTIRLPFGPDTFPKEGAPRDEVVQDLITHLRQAYPDQRVELVTESPFLWAGTEKEKALPGQLGPGGFGQAFLMRIDDDLFVLKVLKPENYEIPFHKEFPALTFMLTPEIENFQAFQLKDGLTFNGFARCYAHFLDKNDESFAMLKSFVGGISLVEAEEKGIEGINRTEAHRLCKKFLEQQRERGWTHLDVTPRDFRLLQDDRGLLLRDADGDPLVMHVDPGVWTAEQRMLKADKYFPAVLAEVMFPLCGPPK